MVCVEQRRVWAKSGEDWNVNEREVLRASRNIY